MTASERTACAAVWAAVYAGTIQARTTAGDSQSRAESAASVQAKLEAEAFLRWSREQDAKDG